MKSIMLVAAAMLAMGSASGQVFKSVGADGKITYSDRPSEQARGTITIMKAPVQAISLPPPAAPAKSRAGIFKKWCAEDEGGAASGDSKQKSANLPLSKA
jgi:hypothetical protein